jgi:hypothetical protein
MQTVVLAVVALLACVLPAQVVTLFNPTPWPMLGWLPAQTTLVTPSLTGFDPMSFASYHAGAQQEPGASTVWVRTFIPAFGTEQVDIAACVPSAQPVSAPPDWAVEYGAWLEIDGTVLNFQIVEQDGPFWVLRGMRMIDPSVGMICTVRWTRGMRYMAQIEASVVYAGSSLAPPTIMLPNSVKARWGSAELWNGPNINSDTATLVPAGLRLRKLEPVHVHTTAVWLSMASPLELNTARALHSAQTFAVAVP